MTVTAERKAERPTFICIGCRGDRHELCAGEGSMRGSFLLPSCDCPHVSHQGGRS